MDVNLEEITSWHVVHQMLITQLPADTVIQMGIDQGNNEQKC